MDEQEEYWLNNEPAVIFVTALKDLGLPYSCEEWGNRGIEGYPLIVEDPAIAEHSIMLDWLHDSNNAFPTYAILDHTMKVRAKPQPYLNNSNSNQCDGSRDTIDNWDGGNTNDFIAQLIEECGSLCTPCNEDDPNDSDDDGISDDCDDCEGYDDDIDTDQDDIPDACDECPNDVDNDIDEDGICGDEDECPNDPNNDLDEDGICGDLDLFPDCHNQSGDLNDDLTIDIQDIMLLLNIILEDLDTISDCQLKDADFNRDQTVNISDIVGMISVILGN